MSHPAAPLAHLADDAAAVAALIELYMDAFRDGIASTLVSAGWPAAAADKEALGVLAGLHADPAPRDSIERVLRAWLTGDMCGAETVTFKVPR